MEEAKFIRKTEDGLAEYEIGTEEKQRAFNEKGEEYKAQKIEPKNECRRFIIKDPETRKRFESLFEKDFISHEELEFIIATIKSCWNNK